MQFPHPRRGLFIIPTTLLVLFVVVIAISLRQPTVSASPPPEAPHFQGEPVTFEVQSPKLVNKQPAQINTPLSDWQIIFEENFEDVNWDVNWINLTIGGDHKFGTEDVSNPLDATSTRVAWAVGNTVGGGPQLDPNTDGYPANSETVLLAGPFDFGDAIASNLSFQYSFSADQSAEFSVSASSDCTVFEGLQISSGGDGSWTEVNYNLDAYAGEPTVCLAFRFRSGATAGVDPGLFIDNVQLRLQFTNKQLLPYVAYGFTPTPIPSPTATATPTPAPNQNYFDFFTDTIVPWEVRRHTLGTSWELIHRSDGDDGRSGFLQLRNNRDESYVLVSPLVRSRQAPYNVQTIALFKDPQNGHSYSIIFGGNWNGQPCPQSDFSSCFTTYYEMRVEYVDAGDDYLRMKLKRVEGHDANNQNFGPDIIPWTKVEDIDPDRWVKWDVTVRENGSISIGAEKRFIASTTDSTYLNQPYFGLMVRNGNNSGARVKFDRFQVDWPDDLTTFDLQEIWSDD